MLYAVVVVVVVVGSNDAYPVTCAVLSGNIDAFMSVFMFANEQLPRVGAFYRMRDVGTSYVIIRR